MGNVMAWQECKIQKSYKLHILYFNWQCGFTLNYPQHMYYYGSTLQLVFKTLHILIF